jgi:hypothetical protein
VELPRLIATVLYVLVGTGGLTIVLCIGLWLLYCRWVVNRAMKLGEKPDPVQVIRASSLGMIGRSPKRSALSSPPKSDDTSLAA